MMGPIIDVKAVKAAEKPRRTRLINKSRKGKDGEGLILWKKIIFV